MGFTIKLSKNIWDTVERTGSDWTKMMIMADGEIYAIPTFNQSYTNEYGGKAFYNTKWLEALNVSAPTTPEELYELLKLVKTTDLNGNGKADEIGMVGNMKGHGGWFNYIMNAYIYAGHSDNLVVTDDDKVIVAYNTEAWKDGLKFMRKLFAEELLPIEILTQDDNQFLAMLNSEECTAMSFYYTSPSRINAANAYRSDFEAYAPLINKDTGKPLATYNPSTPNNGSFFITANFLAGQIDIDAGWDAYVAELENMGLAEYLEIINNVYTRMYVSAE